MNKRELDTKLHELRAAGVGIIDAIKFVRAEQTVNLGEAKGIVSQHAAYRDIHEANETLHDEVIGYVREGLLDKSPRE